jgi:predicted RNase H-like HicB family nuclease
LKERVQVTRYVALVDGKPGAFGVVFPDCPGCTAMGHTVEDALANAVEALADWADDVDPMPKPRSVAELRRDPEVREALADGDALVLVPLVRDSGRAVKANLSLDAGLLAAIDEAAAARGLTRSAFLASAARDKIRTEG